MSTLIAMVIMGLLILIIIGGLTWANYFTASSQNPLVDQVNALLPQTQCAQCGYPGCKPYAQAIIEKNENINRCPPGGDNTIKALSQLLQREILPLDPENGRITPETTVKIRESECIGCTLCIQACPVDAILGAPKQMHTILTSICTGCNLCIAPCPMDCIDIVNGEVKYG